MAFKPVGACAIIVGDPTTAAGADMTSLGALESVQVDIGIRQAYTSSSRQHGTPLADSLYRLAARPQIQAEVTDADIPVIEQLLLGISSTTASSETAIGFGDDFAQIAEANVPALCLLPISQLSDGVGANNAIWFPATTIGGLDGINFGRVDEGEILQPYNALFESAYRETDQDATAIPAGARVGWMGPPAAFGLTWFLPASASI